MTLLVIIIISHASSYDYYSLLNILLLLLLLAFCLMCGGGPGLENLVGCHFGVGQFLARAEPPGSCFLVGRSHPGIVGF